MGFNPENPWVTEALEKIDNGESRKDVTEWILTQDEKLNFDSAYARLRRAIEKHSKEKTKTEMLTLFGLISDTHYGSVDVQKTAIQQLYDKFEERGVKTVFHAGDLTEGMRMRQGHEFECYVDGFDNYVNDVVRNYPERTDMTTKFITGNHDYSFIKHMNADIGTHISSQRDDLVYLGQDWARIDLGGKILELRHPRSGGQDVGASLRRIINAIQDPTEIPDILAVGHYHKAAFFPYKKCCCIGTGGFQALTPFMKNIGTYADVGGWIVEIKEDQIVPEYFSFKTKERDYK